MDSRDPYANAGNDALGELTRLVGQPDPFVASHSVHHGDADIGDDLADDAFFAELESELAVSVADGQGDADDLIGDIDLDIDSAYLEDELAADDAGASGFAGSAPGFATAATQPRERRRSKLVPLAASLLVIAGVGAAGVYGYGGLTAIESGEVPLIKADAGPIKEAVDGPSGREIPHQNKLVYDRVTGEEPEIEQATLLPEPDRVAEMPEADGPIQPRKVRTVTVRPDGTIIRDGNVDLTQPVSAPADQPISSQQVARAVPVRVISSPDGNDAESNVAEPNPLANFGNVDADTAAVEDGDAIAALTASGNAEETMELAAVPLTPDAAAIDAMPSPEGSQALESAAPEVVAALPMPKPDDIVALADTAPAIEAEGPVELAAEPIAASSTGWMVQLTSQRSEEQAQTAFDALKGRFSSVLGTAQPSIARADLGDRGIFYRVRVAADSRAEADQLCGSLKSAGGDCFVQYVN